MSDIISYKVGVTRSHKPGPTRWLTLKLGTPAEGARSAALYFHDKEVPALGYFNRETSSVVINLPSADFEPTYRILNTEKPVFLHLRVQGDEHRLLSFDISTSEEPLGEGPTDRSE
jgi:hypothetical protein